MVLPLGKPHSDWVVKELLVMRRQRWFGAPHKCCPNKTPLGAAEETATDPPKPISDDSGWFVYVALYDK